MHPTLRNHSTFAALHQPSFRRLWAASLASCMAMAAHETAARWLLSKLEAPALLISLASSLAVLPFFVFTFPAGFLADLVDRPRLLRLINVWLTTVAGALAILGFLGKLTGGTVLLGTFGLGIGFAFNAPVWAALLTDLVPCERLASAATLGALQLNLSSLLGPLLGGFLLAAINPNLVFALNAVGFLAMAIALPTSPHAPAAKPFNPRRLVRSLTKVARYVCSSPPLRIVLARNGFFALFVSAIPALLPVIALRDLHLEAARLGLLFTLMSTGSVAASLFLSGWAQRRFFQQSHCPRRQHPVSAHLPRCGLEGFCPIVLVPLAPRGCCMDFVGVRTVGGRTAHYQAMGERTGQRGGDHAFAGSHGRGWYDLGAPRAHVRHATHPGHGRGTVCCLPRPDRAEGRAFWRQAPKVIA